MKLDQLVTGKLYAIPLKKEQARRRLPYGRQQVVDGGMAVPVRLVKIGKFRERMAGACAWEIVEDHYERTAVVELVTQESIDRLPMFDHDGRAIDKHYPRVGSMYSHMPMMPKGPDEKSELLEWEQRVVGTRDLIMPWEDYLKRRGEVEFAVAEVQAYQERIRKNNEAISRIFSTSKKKRPVELSPKFSSGFTRTTLVDTIYVRASEHRISLDDPAAVALWLTQKDAKQVQKLREETALLIEKVSCARRPGRRR